MSLMQPPIDELLEKTENDKFLLCAVASERARDINDMMRGQRDRAKVLNSANQIAQLAGRKPLSLAMEEIERDEISYDYRSFHDLDTIDEDAILTGESLDFVGEEASELPELPELSDQSESSDEISLTL